MPKYGPVADLDHGLGLELCFFTETSPKTAAQYNHWNVFNHFGVLYQLLAAINKLLNTINHIL